MVKKNDVAYAGMFKSRFTDVLIAEGQRQFNHIVFDYYQKSDERVDDRNYSLFISLGATQEGVGHYVNGIDDPNILQYAAGNIATGWLFNVKDLQEYRRTHNVKMTNNEYNPFDPVSRAYYGFLIPLEEADKLAIKKFDFLKNLKPVQV